MHQKFQDRDVVFIGLSPQSASAAPAMLQFLQRAGITWLNGYGAHETLLRLNAEVIPRTWVVGTDGTIVWISTQKSELEAAIEKALASAG